MNRFELIRRTLLWEQVAAAAKAKAAKLRDDLTQDARAEYAEQGTAPTWRLPDIGTVSLPVSKETVYVADEQALTQWAMLHRPDEIETVHRVRPGFVAVLLDLVEHEDGRVFVPSVEYTGADGFADLSGVVIPGLAVREGGRPGSLSFRPSTAAKAVASAGAERLIESVEQAIGEPIVLAEAPDAP